MCSCWTMTQWCEWGEECVFEVGWGDWHLLLRTVLQALNPRRWRPVLEGDSSESDVSTAFLSSAAPSALRGVCSWTISNCEYVDRANANVNPVEHLIGVDEKSYSLTDGSLRDSMSSRSGKENTICHPANTIASEEFHPVEMLGKGSN